MLATCVSALANTAAFGEISPVSRLIGKGSNDPFAIPTMNGRFLRIAVDDGVIDVRPLPAEGLNRSRGSSRERRGERAMG